MFISETPGMWLHAVDLWQQPACHKHLCVSLCHLPMDLPTLAHSHLQGIQSLISAYDSLAGDAITF